ncbi:MAG: ankyrin repeat domain-containing protein [Candidatus Eremiobacteraeota bacterium]|nr:ankyrin repeat domain-containing protein [Candidatus Eremiobacteraeota bacterium]
MGARFIILALLTIILFTGSACADESLSQAIREGDFGEVQAVLTYNRGLVNSPDKHKSMPLHVAAREGRLEIAQFLIEQGADINALDGEKFTAIKIALLKEHYDIAEVLRRQGAVMDIFVYAMIGETGAIEALLAKDRTMVNARDHGLLSPLHWASWGGQVEAAGLLIERGAHIYGKSATGSMALHMAKNGRIAEFLLKKGARLEALNNYGETPLHTLSGLGRVEAVKVLLDQGANVLIQDTLGMTALHIAVRKNHLDVVRLLIERGADVNCHDKQGNSPLRYANLLKRNDVGNILRAHGARD